LWRKRVKGSHLFRMSKYLIKCTLALKHRLKKNYKENSQKIHWEKSNTMQKMLNPSRKKTGKQSPSNWPAGLSLSCSSTLARTSRLRNRTIPRETAHYSDKMKNRIGSRQL